MADTHGSDIETDSGRQSRISREQIQYLSHEAILEDSDPARFSLPAVLLILILLVAGLAWSNIINITTSAHTSGEIVPSGNSRVVQHLEGGIVQEINVRDGVTVQKGDILVRFDRTLRQAELEQVRAREAALEIKSRRLKAFINGTDLELGSLEASYPTLAEQARFSLQATLERLEGQKAVLTSRIGQREKSVDIYRRQAAGLREQQKLVKQNVAIRERLFKAGNGSKVSLISAQLELSRVSASLGESLVSMEQARVGIQEARNQITELNVKERGQALDELTEVLGDLAEVRENIKRLEDRVKRLEIAAPVGGLVHGLTVNTAGAVVEPAQVIMTIVPLEENIVVETRIQPDDVGHIRPGQQAKVVVSGFDARRYGNVTGKLVQISPSTFTDEKGQPYFKGRIMLDQDYIDADGARHQIVPGMTVQADIKIGSQSLTQYLTRPVYASLLGAFSER